METGNARFLENGEVNGSDECKNMEIKEHRDEVIKAIRVGVPLPIPIPSSTFIPNVIPSIENLPNCIEQQVIEESLPEGTSSQMANEDQPQETTLRRS